MKARTDTTFIPYELMRQPAGMPATHKMGPERNAIVLYTTLCVNMSVAFDPSTCFCLFTLTLCFLRANNKKMNEAVDKQICTCIFLSIYFFVPETLMWSFFPKGQ